MSTPTWTALIASIHQIRSSGFDLGQIRVSYVTLLFSIRIVMSVLSLPAFKSFNPVQYMVLVFMLMFGGGTIVSVLGSQVPEWLQRNDALFVYLFVSSLFYCFPVIQSFFNKKLVKMFVYAADGVSRASASVLTVTPLLGSGNFPWIPSLVLGTIAASGGGMFSYLVSATQTTWKLQTPSVNMISMDVCLAFVSSLVYLVLRKSEIDHEHCFAMCCWLNALVLPFTIEEPEPKRRDSMVFPVPKKRSILESSDVELPPPPPKRRTNSRSSDDEPRKLRKRK